MAPVKEFPVGDQRPGDLFLPNWIEGRGICIDTSIVNPHINLSPVALRTPGFAAQTMIAQKNAAYTDLCTNAGYHFLPFVMESAGGFGANCSTIIERIGSAIAAVHQIPQTSAINQLYRKISFTLQSMIGSALSDAHNIRLASFGFVQANVYGTRPSQRNLV